MKLLGISILRATLFVLLSVALPVYAEYKDRLEVPAAMMEKPLPAQLTAAAEAGTHLIAVGRRGLIVVSENAGKTWRQAKVPTSVDLTAIHFVSADEGWVVGHGGVILHSMDGGFTWEKKLDGRKVGKLLNDYYSDPNKVGENIERYIQVGARFLQDGPIHPFLDIWFASKKIGFVVGAFNLILRTDDGGVTWVPWLDRTENLNEMHFYGIRGTDSENIIAFGERGLLLKMDPKTNRFVPVEVPYSGSFFGAITKNKTILIYGLKGEVYRSPDFGTKWNRVALATQAAITGSAVLENGNIVLASQGGGLFSSGDDGVTFATIPISGSGSFSSISGAGKGKVAIFGMQGVNLETIQ